jgi:Putative MetA-pathway of phenol degradation
MGKIDTDGPDFVESSASVGKGRFQFETGPSFQRDTHNGANQRTESMPLLLKLGVSDAVEARLETDSLTRVSGQGPSDATTASQTGFADTALGLKWHAQDQNPSSGAPSVAWILHFELPSGTSDLRGHGVRPFLRSVISWDLPYSFYLGAMPGIKYDSRADGTRFESGIFGIVLGRWWTERFRAFIEVSAPQIAAAPNGGVVLYDDIGAAYLISDNWQIGGRAGWAANRNSPSEYFLLSLAARF